MNPYTILNVPPDATIEQIRAAYRDLVKLHHPDKGGDHNTFVAIQTAFDILSDPARRQHFDETGSTNPRTPTPQAELLNLIASVIENISDPSTTDILELTRKAILESQRQYKSEASKLRARADKFHSAAQRISHNGRTNPAADHLNAKAEALLAQASANDEQRDFGDRLLSLLDSYSYTHDKPTHQYSPWTIYPTPSFADLLRNNKP